MRKFIFLIIISIKSGVILYAQTGFAGNAKISQDDHLFGFYAPLHKGRFFKIKPTEKGDVFINFTIPEGNSF